MKIIHSDKPWNHFEVYGFLNSKEIAQVKSLYSHIWYPDETTKRSTYFIDTNMRHPEEVMQVHSMLSAKFKKLCKAVDSWDDDRDEIFIELDQILPNFNYPIHNDIWTKTLTFVLHISDSGHGTRLYVNEDDETPFKTMKWIPGGGGGFKRFDYCHHSFDTLEDSFIRQTVVITRRFKGAKPEDFKEDYI